METPTWHTVGSSTETEDIAAAFVVAVDNLVDSCEANILVMKAVVMGTVVAAADSRHSCFRKIVDVVEAAGTVVHAGSVDFVDMAVMVSIENTDTVQPWSREEVEICSTSLAAVGAQRKTSPIITPEPFQ